MLTSAGLASSKLSLGRAEVDALLQGLEQFGEAHFLLALLGHVAPQHARAYHFVSFDDAIQHAFEIERPRTVLQADA